MAVFQVTTTGTKTSGDSTPGDWADNSNNYGQIRLAINNTAADGDEVIIDDGTYSETFSASATGTGAASGTITISSRNENPELAMWDCAQDNAPNFVYNESVNFTLKNISLISSITTLGGSNFSKLIRHTGSGNLTLDNCIFKDVAITSTVASTEGFLFNVSAGTITILNGLTVKDITITTARIINGLINFVGVTTVIDDITVDNINIIATDTSDNTAIMRDGSSGTSTHTGTISINDVSLTCTDNSGGILGFMRVDGAGTLAYNDIDFSNITGEVILDVADGLALYVATTASFNNVSASNVVLTYPATRTKANQTRRCHGIAVFVEDSGVLTANSITASNCSGIIGSGFYTNGGATATIGLLDCTGCTDDAYATCYLGGWGDVTIDALNLTGNTVLNEDRVEIVFAGILYPYLHENAIRNRVITIGNMTLAGNTVNAGDSGYTLAPLFPRNGDELIYTLTLNISNSIIESETADSGILYDPNTHGGVTATIDNSYVEGGSGALTDIALTNEITGVVLDSSYGLASGSAGIGEGARWWTGANPVGASGEPFSDFDTDIGASQSTHGPFHPVNL